MGFATDDRTARTSKDGSDTRGEENARTNGRGTSGFGGEVQAEPEFGEARVGGQSAAEDTDAEVIKPFEQSIREKATKVLDAIGQEFNELYETDPSKAWKMYRRRFMENFGILSEVMSPKDITDLSLKVDEHMRVKVEGESGNMLDVVRSFLGEVH